ncbi:MAG TPA: hypothetical protein VMS65_06175, partial [Polyangiaceae bacterium]|nr:hypothetical protein [Polyangiaceae bacterium]
DEARYAEPLACSSGTACVPGSASLARLGCIECVPRDPTNPEQVPDSRCVVNQLEVCGPGGTWTTGSATSCPAGCSGSQGGDTLPGNARAQCRPSTGGGGQSGSGPSAGTGGLGNAGGGAGGAAGTINGGGGIDR